MDSRRTLFEVDGKPFIAIAGEVHNSNSSDPVYMEAVWEKAGELGLNTLLLPVSWEMVEPEEDRFDFTVVDALISQARQRNMKIVFLWFGSWKNAQCMYAPEWVKRDLKRFPRAQVVKGENKTSLEMFHGMSYTTLSYLGEETCRADAKAFSRLMAHLKAVDGLQKTVIGVQVENETGLQGSDREHSDLADALFAGQVEPGLLAYLREHTGQMDPRLKDALDEGNGSGTWEQVFGPLAGEAFSAYHVASFVQKVAQAGKDIYPLPMAVNCWLEQGQPGAYPSGGPVAKMMEIWQYAAPAIDVICPDIYVRYFLEVCDSYTKWGNPLFIPETATHSHAAPRLVYCVGHHHAACYAPFGFEDMGQPFTMMQGFLFGMDTSDPLLQTPQNVQEYRWCCETLGSMMDLLTARYGTDKLQAVISEEFTGDVTTKTMLFGDYSFAVMMNHPMITRKDGVCMILQESEDTFYVLANGCMVVPMSASEQAPHVDLLRVQEGCIRDGVWCPGRWLNGDETSRLSFDSYTLLKLKLFRYS